MSSNILLTAIEIEYLRTTLEDKRKSYRPDNYHRKCSSDHRKRVKSISEEVLPIFLESKRKRGEILLDLQDAINVTLH